jgi:dienelactone hydrolase
LRPTLWLQVVLAARSASPIRDAEIHRYPGTGHWFAEPSRDAYRPEAAELAFERTVEFLERQLGTPAG